VTTENPYSAVLYYIIVGVAFAFWMNKHPPSLGSIGRPWERVSPDSLVQRHRNQAHAELKWAPSERTVESHEAISEKNKRPCYRLMPNAARQQGYDQLAHVLCYSKTSLSWTFQCSRHHCSQVLSASRHHSFVLFDGKSASFPPSSDSACLRHGIMPTENIKSDLKVFHFAIFRCVKLFRTS
jgi:hypothetical protein